MRRAFWVVGLVLLASVAFASGQSEAEGDEDRLEIGAIVLDTRGEWMSEVIHGVNAAGEELGVDVIVQSSDADINREADIIDNFIAQQIDGLAWMPQSDQASVAAFNRAYDADNPIVTFNSRVDTPNSKYFVGVDNYDLGRLTGEHAVEYIQNHMGGEAKIAVIGITKYSVGIERVDGFMEVVQELPGVEIVAKQDAEFREEGLEVVESVLQANPDTDLIWCWNLTSMLGAAAAVQSAGLQDDIVMMGTDMSLDVARLMLNEDSFLKAVTTQQPYEIGYRSIENAVELAQTGETDTTVLVPLKTYTSDEKGELQQYIEERDYLTE